MSAGKSSVEFKTWIEIDSAAVRRNLKTFRGLVGAETKIWSVVKSNAYGHGLYVFGKLADKSGADGFCVDSVVEGIRLRNEGIKKPILVLGPTLFNRIEEAAANDITVSIPNFESLKLLQRAKIKPKFHLKIDSGMHRQGFYVENIHSALKIIRNPKYGMRDFLQGAYTHFASATDISQPAYTENQFGKFRQARRIIEKSGRKNLIFHAAASGGTLMGKKYHLDAVRLGAGLYGLWPSEELHTQLSQKINLQPVLSWRTVVSEIKNLKAGDCIGYDLTEWVSKPSKAAVLPIGYWHGFPRSFSSIGGALIKGRRVKVLGRVSMDLTVVDTTGIGCQVGDIATLVGKDGQEEISADAAATLSGTIHYEFLTRLNPLIERVVK